MQRARAREKLKRRLDGALEAASDSCESRRRVSQQSAAAATTTIGGGDDDDRRRLIARALRAATLVPRHKTRRKARDGGRAAN